MKKILVIGSLNVDFVMRVASIPQEGETIIGSDFKQFLGGKGANQACAAARLGGDVRMLGCIGGDEKGQYLLSGLRGDGVNVEHLITTDEATGFAFITIDNKGQNAIVVVPGANYSFTKELVEKNASLLEEADIILLQLEIPIETVEYVIEKAHALGKTIILNPAPYMELKKEVLVKVNILTPNEVELEALVKPGEKITMEERAMILLQMGLEDVIVTLGKKGAFHVSHDGIQDFKAYDVNAVDTTGAGDCFNGALAVGLALGKPLKEAIKLAMKASAVSVTREGAQASLPTADELSNIVLTKKGGL